MYDETKTTDENDVRPKSKEEWQMLCEMAFTKPFVDSSRREHESYENFYYRHIDDEKKWFQLDGATPQVSSSVEGFDLLHVGSEYAIGVVLRNRPSPKRDVKEKDILVGSDDVTVLPWSPNRTVLPRKWKKAGKNRELQTDYLDRMTVAEKTRGDIMWCYLLAEKPEWRKIPSLVNQKVPVAVTTHENTLLVVSELGRKLQTYRLPRGVPEFPEPVEVPLTEGMAIRCYMNGEYVILYYLVDGLVGPVLPVFRRTPKGLECHRIVYPRSSVSRVCLDGDLLALGSMNGNTQVVNLKDDTVPFEFMPQPKRRLPITSLLFTNGRLVTVDALGIVRYWEDDQVVNPVLMYYQPSKKSKELEMCASLNLWGNVLVFHAVSNRVYIQNAFTKEASVRLLPTSWLPKSLSILQQTTHISSGRISIFYRNGAIGTLE